MKPVPVVLLALASCAASLPGQSAAPADLKPLWSTRSAHIFREALRPDLGFSFTYDGKRVGPRLPADWKLSAEGGGAVTLRHPSGLAVTRVVRTWPDCDAIEYTLQFKNEGATALAALSSVNAMDLTFGGDMSQVGVFDWVENCTVDGVEMQSHSQLTGIWPVAAISWSGKTFTGFVALTGISYPGGSDIVQDPEVSSEAITDVAKASSNPGSIDTPTSGAQFQLYRNVFLFHFDCASAISMEPCR
jgi:hypothetical protein